MTNDDKAVIAKLAEWVGWKYSEGSNGEEWHNEHEYRYPFDAREHLHALAGLVEDELRGGHGGLWIRTGLTPNGFEKTSVGALGYPVKNGRNRDPLLAKLHAFAQLVEHLEPSQAQERAIS